MSVKYRILVVEDEPIIADDIAGFLVENGFEIAGITHTAEKAINCLKDNVIDAAVLDINLGDGMDGIQLAEIIHDKFQIPFVFCTAHGDRATIERAKSTFPSGYLLKPFNEKELFAALDIALYQYIQRKNKSFNLLKLNEFIPDPLSEREMELLAELIKGRSNREIAEAQYVSVNTVKTHLQHIFQKLDVRNRTEALFKIGQWSL
jgi:DNA-binding NarL/FixJ family response regulator